MAEEPGGFSQGNKLTERKTGDCLGVDDLRRLSKMKAMKIVY